MSDRKFNTVPVKNTIVPADVVIVVDSEDSQKLKQVPATAFVGATGPQGPQGEPGTSTDATSIAKGVIQLTGDLGGTAASPTVPGLDTKQDTLVSGTNIKTVNGENILGSGNLEVSAGSGGYAANVYLQSTASTTVGAYNALSYIPELAAGFVSAAPNNNEVPLKTFIYDADVSATLVDAGEWSFHTNYSVSSPAGVTKLRYVPFKRTSGGVETDLFSVETVELNATTDTDVITTTTQPSFVTNATDRLGLRIFASTTNNSAVTVTVTVGDGNATFFNTPLAIRHSQLRARDAYDSHPISAITSLQSTLDGKADLSGATFTGDIIVPDEAYDATTWNGNLEVPTKNAIRDKIESMGSGGSSLWTAVTGTRTSDTTFTLTGDVTSTFSRGLVIKWTESSSKKCGYVVSSSYSSPDTTVTIIGDTMAYIDSSSLKWTAIPAQSMRFAVAGSIGATGTDVANTQRATEPLRVLGANLWVGSAGTTDSTTIDLNKAGTTMFTTKPSLASTVAYSSTPFTADSGTSIAVGDAVTEDVDGVQTTPAVDLYSELITFPTRILNLA